VVFGAAAGRIVGCRGHPAAGGKPDATKVLGVGGGGAVISTDAALVERITAMTGFGFLVDARSSCWTRT
jgi:dTDP-4-amino-4,6-dideoxygalactose transaminase